MIKIQYISFLKYTMEAVLLGAISHFSDFLQQNWKIEKMVNIYTYIALFTFLRRPKALYSHKSILPIHTLMVALFFTAVQEFPFNIQMFKTSDLLDLWELFGRHSLNEAWGIKVLWIVNILEKAEYKCTPLGTFKR